MTILASALLAGLIITAIWWKNRMVWTERFRMRAEVAVLRAEVVAAIIEVNVDDGRITTHLDRRGYQRIAAIDQNIFFERRPSR
jgi:multidrug resistance efflux pump